jgi:hypothetical protein
LEALTHASSIELYQLSAALDRLMLDPRRIVQIRKDLHLGQTIRFVDARTGQLHGGQVLAMQDTTLVVREAGTKRQLKLPYVAIEPPTAQEGTAAPAPLPRRPARDDFRCGEKVSFEDRHLNTVVGTIVRINQRTATIDPGDGTSWRVGFALLRHVVDI